MNTVGIDAQTCQVIDVAVDGGLAVDAQIAHRPISVRERECVVDSEERSLGLGVRPTHYALAIYKNSGYFFVCPSR